MIRFLACVFMISLAGAQDSVFEDEVTGWSEMDQAFREKSDELAQSASSFERAGEYIGAADLYREALEVLTIDPENGWRFNAYRESYLEVIGKQDFLKKAKLPGSQFDGEKWEGFSPALLEGTILPELEFKGKPLGECLDWLKSEYARQNPGQRELRIEIRFRQYGDGSGEAEQAEAAAHNSEVTLRLKDVPFSEVLRYVGALQNMRIKSSDDYFFLEPISSHSRDIPTLLWKVNSAILTGEFGSGEELMKEAGIGLRDYMSVNFLTNIDGLLARASEEKMVEIVLWIRALDRVENPEQAKCYAGECLKLADYYFELGETELSDRRRRQASQTLIWLERLHAK